MDNQSFVLLPFKNNVDHESLLFPMYSPRKKYRDFKEIYLVENSPFIQF